MDLFKLLGTIAIDSTNAKQEIDKYIDKAKESEAETSDAFSKIGSVAGNIAKGIGIAGAAIATLIAQGISGAGIYALAAVAAKVALAGGIVAKFNVYKQLAQKEV